MAAESFLEFGLGDEDDRVAGVQAGRGRREHGFAVAQDYADSSALLGQPQVLRR